MKLTKTKLKQIIKEELGKIKEIRTIPFEGDHPPNIEKYTALWELITRMNDPHASYDGSDFMKIARATKGPTRQVTNASYLMENFIKELNEIMKDA